MLGKTFFLDRAIPRSLDWIGRYPALGCASHDPQSISSGRQIVVAAADDHGVRCAFFSSIGSVQDFSATWAELSNAQQWWHFVGRWYFWVADCESTLGIIQRSSHSEAAGYAFGSAAVDPHANAFLELLDRIETRARRTLSVCMPQALQTLVE